MSGVQMKEIGCVYPGDESGQKWYRYIALITTIFKEWNAYKVC